MATTAESLPLDTPETHPELLPRSDEENEEQQIPFPNILSPDLALIRLLPLSNPCSPPTTDEESDYDFN